MLLAGAVLAGGLKLADLRGVWQDEKVKERFLNMDSHLGGCPGSGQFVRIA